MEIGKAFENLKAYNENMSKGMEDKLFFLEHLPKENGYIFVDFGCADGALINMLHHLCSSGNQYIGFDISETMIDLAKSKMTYSPKNVLFTSDWRDVQYELLGSSLKKVLILSSVVHEVYSYGTEKDIEIFWDRVLNSGFDYICIRDMMVPSDTQETTTDPGWINNITWDAAGCVSPARRQEFIKIWGPLNIKKNALHFLLKYRWQINWDREVHENYFPIDIEDFLDKFRCGYNMDYFERFKVPFLNNCIKDDYLITLGDADFTHIKTIFSKKTNIT